MSDEVKEKKQQPMHMHWLKGDTVFVRAFRWTLEAKTLPAWTLAAVELDRVDRTLFVKAHEIVFAGGKIPIMTWIDNAAYKHEPLTLTTFDAMGNALYAVELSGLNLVKDHIAFDYADSDIATRNLTFTYAHYTRVDWPNPNSEYEAEIPAEEPTFVPLESKEAEVTEVPFLNTTTPIPGKISKSSRRSSSPRKSRSRKSGVQEQPQTQPDHPSDT